jgi:polyphenol oxidase
MTPVVTFPCLDRIPGVSALFLGRTHGESFSGDKEESLRILEPYHHGVLSRRIPGNFPLITCEQVHGKTVFEITEPRSTVLPNADGLMTQVRGVTLGIHVADCAPVWIVAQDGSVGALLHSGKKGTELGITSVGIALLIGATGRPAEDFVVVVGPCIRPPCYEVDFAKEIRREARNAGISQIHDEGICTACHPDLYYSYRRESGKTGRMLATLTLLPEGTFL